MKKTDRVIEKEPPNQPKHGNIQTPTPIAYHQHNYGNNTEHQHPPLANNLRNWATKFQASAKPRPHNPKENLNIRSDSITCRYRTVPYRTVYHPSQTRKTPVMGKAGYKSALQAFEAPPLPAIARCPIPYDYPCAVHMMMNGFFLAYYHR